MKSSSFAVLTRISPGCKSVSMNVHLKRTVAVDVVPMKLQQELLPGPGISSKATRCGQRERDMKVSRGTGGLVL